MLEAVNKALVCIGDRSRDENALLFTRKILLAFNLQPTLFHVTSSGSCPRKGNQLLQAAQEIIAIDTAELRCEEGNVRRSIAKELKKQEYHLVIVCTSHRDPDERPSPLSRHLANSVNTSVLLIRNPPEEICQILICTGGHDESANAIEWGIHLAKETNDQATILHVVSSPPAMYTGLDEIEEDLSEVLARDVPLSHHLKDAAQLAEEHGVQAKLELRHGLVIEEILRSAEINSHDLIIIGAPKPRSLSKQILLGRIAPKLLASTIRSTLIVRRELK
jgi:nucleotide-binding universal stress UspA family protein